MSEKFDIVFLDIDGVICTNESIEQAISDWCGGIDLDKPKWQSEFLRITKSAGFTPKLNLEHWPFDRFALKNIHELARTKNVRFVISSTWRIGKSMEELIGLFTMKGLNVRIIDKTRDDDRSSSRDTRGHQIKAWLDANKNIVDNFVILDDNTWDITPLFPHNTITVRADIGFSKKDLDKAKEILFS